MLHPLLIKIGSSGRPPAYKTPLRRISTPRDRSFEAAVQELMTFQSNAASLEQWNQWRKQNKLGEVQVIREMHECLEKLKLDLRSLRVVHVSGTKGKGSVCAFVERMLREQGLRTGLYTSPHLVDICERIRLDGQPISHQRFADLFWRVRDGLGDAPPPAFFRFVTLMGLQALVDARVDVAVVEVGIGGRTDATNVFPREAVLACGVTAIGHDHQEVLGDTLAEIAREEAGICKPRVPALTVPDQPPEAMHSLLQHARSQQLALELVPPLHEYSPAPVLGLAGRHQRSNAALALGLVRVTRGEPLPLARDATISPADLRALANTRWAGRGQKLRLTERVQLYLDGAHTPESTAACGEWFGRELSSAGGGASALVFGCKSNRNPEALLQPLLASELPAPLSLVLLVAEPALGAPAASAERSAQLVQAWEASRAGAGSAGRGARLQLAANWAEAERMLRAHSGPEMHVLVTGSLYLVGAALASLGQQG